jgi:diguanylate cyclase (GGDEF)-like protein/PAS domain S-box-containing protein
MSAQFLGGPHRGLSIGEILGLTAPESEDWARLRGLQYARLAEASRLRWLSHGFAALTTVWLFFGVAGPRQAFGWLAVLGCVMVYSVSCDKSLDDTDRRRMTRDEFQRQAGASALVALCWVAPIGFFAHHASESVRLELWMILALLMTIKAVVIPAAPLSTLLFSGIVGIGSVFGFIQGGAQGSGQGNGMPMAVIAGLFVIAIMTGTIETARNFLLSRIAEAGVADRNEVVSLLLREFEESDADWLWEIDVQRRVRGSSSRFAYALGLEPDQIDGQSFIQLIAGPNWETGQFDSTLHDLFERMRLRDSFSQLLVRVNVRGEPRWWELSGTPRFDDAGHFDGFRGVGSDVTEARESSDKMAWMARYDTLTGLPNRMMLTEALHTALHESELLRRRCAFLMIDLDRFKAVNDTLGHLVGDQLLARVAERLKSLVTENALCGRLGGDEFAVVVRDTRDQAAVARVAEAVIARLSEPYAIDNHVLYVGASVGSAMGPGDGETVETLMRNADLALYRAKDGGGGVHCAYEPTFQAQAEERRKLEASLRHALERNEFSLAFQPVVDVADESVISFEALLRWNSPEHGQVRPAKFLPIAEDSRQIVPIGAWVLREACRQASRWPAPVKVAVNLSAEQLLDPELNAHVVTALAIAGLPAQRLEIEVTESVFVRDAVSARAALERIMALGCGVALDDFGTGTSSLGYIRKLRFSTIKVDRSFVQGAATGNHESLAIIRAVVAMAESLEMSTTAEGVETEAELTAVRSLGCRTVQGHLFGRAMAADDAARLVAPVREMRA